MKKYLLLFLSVFFLISCDQSDKSDPFSEKGLSEDQQWLYSTMGAYKKEFDGAKNGVIEKNISEKYRKIINDYLESHDRKLDSMKVYVQKIDMLSDLSFSLDFYDKYADYSFISSFKNKPTGEDSLYNLMQTFKEGSDALSSFVVIDVNFNGGFHPLSLEAIPISLTAKAKNKQ